MSLVSYYAIIKSLHRVVWYEEKIETKFM